MMSQGGVYRNPDKDITVVVVSDDAYNAYLPPYVAPVLPKDSGGVTIPIQMASGFVGGQIHLGDMMSVEEEEFKEKLGELADPHLDIMLETIGRIFGY